MTRTKGSIPKPENPSREAVRDKLLEGRQNRYDPRLIARFGPAAGIFLSQLLFWDGKGRDPLGFIFKPKLQMQQETGLSRRQQDKARRILTAAGVLEEELRPSPAGPSKVLHFRLDLAALCELLGVDLGESDAGDSDGTGNTGPVEEPTNTGPVEEPGDTGPVEEPGDTGPLHAQRLPQETTSRDYKQKSFVLDRTSGPDAPRRTLTPAREEIFEVSGIAGDAELDHIPTPEEPDPSPEPLSGLTLNKVWRLLLEEDADSEPRRLALAHVTGADVDGEPVSVERVAEAVRQRLRDENGSLPSYTEAVERALPEIRWDLERATA